MPKEFYVQLSCLLWLSFLLWMQKSSRLNNHWAIHAVLGGAKCLVSASVNLLGWSPLLGNAKGVTPFRINSLSFERRTDFDCHLGVLSSLSSVDADFQRCNFSHLASLWWQRLTCDETSSWCRITQSLSLFYTEILIVLKIDHRIDFQRRWNRLLLWFLPNALGLWCSRHCAYATGLAITGKMRYTGSLCCQRIK